MGIPSPYTRDGNGPPGGSQYMPHRLPPPQTSSGYTADNHDLEVRHLPYKARKKSAYHQPLSFTVRCWVS